jgi:hypothetical protein
MTSSETLEMPAPLLTDQHTLDVLYKAFFLVDQALEKHGVPYFMIGGTLLGAWRHGGVIPWDDDGDLAVELRHFAKVRQLVVPELESLGVGCSFGRMGNLKLWRAVFSCLKATSPGHVIPRWTSFPSKRLTAGGPSFLPPAANAGEGSISRGENWKGWKGLPSARWRCPPRVRPPARAICAGPMATTTTPGASSAIRTSRARRVGDFCLLSALEAMMACRFVVVATQATCSGTASR